METIHYGLSDYLTKVEEAFALPVMTEGQQEVAKLKFNAYVRENKLSINDAIDILSDTKQILPYIAAGIKSGDFEAAAEQESVLDSNQQISDFREDINYILKAVQDFAAVGEKTNSILKNLENFSREAQRRASKNERLLSDVHEAARDLKNSMTVAIDTSKDVVKKLEGIPPRLDGQLLKIENVEKDIQKAATVITTTHAVAADVKTQTDPVKTHEENVRMLRKSVIYSTLFGTAASVLTNAAIEVYRTDHQPPSAIVSKQDQPRSYTVHNKTTGTIYEIEEFPSSTKAPFGNNRSEKKTSNHEAVTPLQTQQAQSDAQKIGSDDYMDAGASRPHRLRELPKTSSELKK